MDDGYVVEPRSVALAAVCQFSEAIRALGLELRIDKCFCFSPADGLDECLHRPAVFPVGCVQTGGGQGFGILVSGIPIGDEVFVQAKLETNVEKTVSKSKLLLRSSSMSTSSLFSLHIILWIFASSRFLATTFLPRRCC